MAAVDLHGTPRLVNGHDLIVGQHSAPSTVNLKLTLKGHKVPSILVGTSLELTSQQYVLWELCSNVSDIVLLYTGVEHAALIASEC